MRSVLNRVSYERRHLPQASVYIQTPHIDESHEKNVFVPLPEASGKTIEEGQSSGVHVLVEVVGVTVGVKPHLQSLQSPSLKLSPSVPISHASLGESLHILVLTVKHKLPPIGIENPLSTNVPPV